MNHNFYGFPKGLPLDSLAMSYDMRRSQGMKRILRAVSTVQNVVTHDGGSKGLSLFSMIRAVGLLYSLVPGLPSSFLSWTSGQASPNTPSPLSRAAGTASPYGDVALLGGSSAINYFSSLRSRSEEEMVQ